MTILLRRDFIKLTGFALVTCFSYFYRGCKRTASIVFFTPEEILCIIAFCKQIIPKDEFPRATDAGVIN